MDEAKVSFQLPTDPGNDFPPPHTSLCSRLRNSRANIALNMQWKFHFCSLFMTSWLTHTLGAGRLRGERSAFRSSFISTHSGSSFLCNFHVIIFHPQLASFIALFAPSSASPHPPRVHVCIYYCTKVVYSSNKNPPSLCSTLFFWRRRRQQFFFSPVFSTRRRSSATSRLSAHHKNWNSEAFVARWLKLNGGDATGGESFAVLRWESLRVFRVSWLENSENSNSSQQFFVVKTWENSARAFPRNIKSFRQRFRDKNQKFRDLFSVLENFSNFFLVKLKSFPLDHTKVRC